MLTTLPHPVRAVRWPPLALSALAGALLLFGTLQVGGLPRWPLALLAAGVLGLGSLPAALLWRGGATITGGQTWGWGAARAALLLAALLSASFAQKAWRLAAPDTGWRSTVAFIGDDRPLFVEALAVGQNASLRPGDQLVGINGHIMPVGTDGWLDPARLPAWSAAVGPLRDGQAVTFTVRRGVEGLGETFNTKGGRQLTVPGTLHATDTPTLLRALGRVLPGFFNQGVTGGGGAWGLLEFLLVMAVTVWLFWQRPNHPGAQLLALSVWAVLVTLPSWLVGPLTLSDLLSPAQGAVGGAFSHSIHIWLLAPLSLHLCWSFLRAPARARVLVPLVYGYAAWASFGPGSPLAVLNVLIGYPLLSVVCLGIAAWQSRAQGRLQLLWLAVAILPDSLNTAIFILGQFTQSDVLSGLSSVLPSTLLFVVGMTLAVLHTRLFDLRLFLNRALVFAVLAALVAGCYALGVLLVGQQVRQQVGGSAGVSAAVLGALLVAVTFEPVRAAARRSVTRLLFGERDDPARVLSTLGQRLQGTVQPAELLPTIARTVAGALRLPRVEVHDGAGHHAASGEDAPRGEALMYRLDAPDHASGEPVGELRVWPRGPEGFTVSETELLHALSRQAGLAVHSARLGLDVQQAREALVYAREEERRRLRRDLHDGLGPALAGVTWGLSAARTQLTTDPAGAAGLLEHLEHETQGLVADVRRLVDELRPPALDDLGLGGALRERVLARLSATRPDLHVSSQLPPSLPTLPAAVEVAALRIAEEALTNAARHAHASVVQFTLSATPAALTLRVQDDGRGLPQPVVPGIGLASMRERAEELGGHVSVQAVPGGGTCVIAVLPLGAVHA
ncbi:sensor histidine kinase [Deinococcus sp.]|uniref:sensor histidine kinase n=1 Tax=Deinococcus sp. TaxID=47478 RepID=UPI002869B02B|nr:sensor histidine kinase [Deinococcus sp.]